MRLLNAAAKAIAVLLLMTVIVVIGSLIGLWAGRDQPLVAVVLSVLMLFVALTLGIFLMERDS
jgi:hypothetical protein